MLSYRHSFHAGNYADVIKHIVLIEILEHLIKKDSAFDYIDSHAGAGLYNLHSEHAAKLQEYTQGVGKLKTEQWPELATYFDILAKYNPAGKLNFYPGSPIIAQYFLRRKDRSWLYELHPKDAELLLKHAAKSRNIRVMREDGFKGLLSLLPPVSRRGLVLIDPSYEIKTDYAQVFNTIDSAYKKFPTGIYALWYPVVDRKIIDHLERKFKRSGIKKIHRYELGIAQDQFGSGMSACGMIVINPPWTLTDKMSQVFPKLVTALGGEGAFYKCDVLVGE
ncbi:MAG: 23S rRNA (adenine(2030)-N(6))-methyltransferase RlmJ [Gammaproteobacteria bacterium]|nr:MAG: 23S rRNA (adenine(2030)-N(6))-methyltransferase RlmJ [Gammaproteobacteria bacterium]